jgi:hypothetical protein
MLLSTGFPASLEAAMAWFMRTNSLPPPIGIGLGAGIGVAVNMTETAPSGGIL